jgi:hypothetical protein
MSQDWMATLKQLAPTVASAFLGPLGGIAVAALGNLLGVSDATQDKIAEIISNGQLTPEQITEIKRLELEYQESEKERQFKYADLEFRDRDSARTANVSGGTQVMLFWMSIVLLVLTLGSEIWVLFNGVPPGTPELIIGRVLGLMDSVALMVLAYWFGSSSGSRAKTELLANSSPNK